MFLVQFIVYGSPACGHFIIVVFMLKYRSLIVSYRIIFKTCSEYDHYTCLMTSTKPTSFLFAYCYMSTLKGVLLDACLFLWKFLVTFRIAPSCTMRQARRAVLRASHRPECSRPSNCRPSSESACWRPCGRLL